MLPLITMQSIKAALRGAAQRCAELRSAARRRAALRSAARSVNAVLLHGI